MSNVNGRYIYIFASCSFSCFLGRGRTDPPFTPRSVQMVYFYNNLVLVQIIMPTKIL